METEKIVGVVLVYITNTPFIGVLYSSLYTREEDKEMDVM